MDVDWQNCDGDFFIGTEKNSKNTIFPPDQPKDHWYEALWSLIKTPTFDDFKEQQLTVITFNYDRSLEHYLSHVMSNNFEISVNTASESLPIIHVHGGLGKYDADLYGGAITDEMIASASSSIRIIHEADVEHTEFVAARRTIRDADITCFLGFGYHKANMNKLGFPMGFRKGKLTVGTHKGIKSQPWQNICVSNGFSSSARNSGAGSVSEFIYEWLR